MLPATHDFATDSLNIEKLLEPGKRIILFREQKLALSGSSHDLPWIRQNTFPAEIGKLSIC